MRRIDADALKKTMLNYIDCEKCTHKDTTFCADRCTAYDFLVMLEEAPTVCDEDPAIPTFNRKELEKARDYWYSHLEAHNEEQNEAAWAAINAIKYCIEHDSGYQEGAT